MTASFYDSYNDLSIIVWDYEAAEGIRRLLDLLDIGYGEFGYDQFINSAITSFREDTGLLYSLSMKLKPSNIRQ